MFLSNLLRSIVFAVAAIFLIFIQDHSVVLGATVLLIVSALVGFIALLVVIRREVKENFASDLFVAAISLTVSMYLLTTNGFLGLQNTEGDLVIFRAMTAVFIGGIALTELLQSRKAQSGDRLEFRISAGVGLIATVLFSLAPLNDVNAVGFLSAYLAISAAQRGIWLATPGKQVKNGK